jgi:hypothetical protein
VKVGLVELIERDLIDLDNSYNAEYLWERFAEHSAIVAQAPLYFLPDRSFLETATRSADKGQYAVAIVLIATEIEHAINSFYSIALRRKGFSTKEVIRIIRSTNNEGKLTWLLKLTTEEEFGQETLREIRSVFEVRNAVVHFKGTPTTIANVVADNNSGWFSILSRLSKLDYDHLIELPIQLEDIFLSILRERFPVYDEVTKLIDVMLDA